MICHVFYAVYLRPPVLHRGVMMWVVLKLQKIWKEAALV
jgi:hypothetical protein